MALVGKPNVGKSTLVNRLVGEKVAITSSKPQTTRHRVLGVMHGEDHQVVLVDTPGLMKANHLLGRKMEQWALDESREADLILFVVELTHAPTAEDESVASLLQQLKPPLWLVLNKSDREKAGAAELYRSLAPEAEQFVCSGLSGQGVEGLSSRLRQEMPEGHPYFPPEQVSDQNRRLFASEMIREKVLLNTRQEIPHSVAVMVEELRPGDNPDVLYVNAYLFVERDTQKKILIGRGGQLLKKIGAEARVELESLWDTRVFLDLWVKVKENWRERADWLRSLGYE